jgi:hypothetical protein
LSLSPLPNPDVFDRVKSYLALSARASPKRVGQFVRFT